jgi:hypothetical protein
VLADGTRLALRRRLDPGEKKVPAEIVVAPLHAEEIALVPTEPARGSLVSLEIVSQDLERTVAVRDPYAPAVPLLTVPPVAPAGPPEAPVSPAGPTVQDALGWEEVTAAIVVGADGKVASVTVIPDEAGKTARAALADAVVAAARTWTYEPARRGSAAERSVVASRFRFGARRLVRRVFGVAAKDLEPRLTRYLHDAYPWVVDVRQARGYAIADRPWKRKGIRGADAWLVRLGEAAPSRTWVAVTSMTLLVRESAGGSSCECYWRVAQESGARDFMDLLAARLELTAVEARELAPQQGSLIPSGTLEPDEAGRWSRAAVGRLFDASFSTILGKNKKKVAFSGILSRLEPNQPPPPAAQFTVEAAGAGGTEGAGGAQGATADPIRVEGDVVPPVLVRRVSPEYPAEAKAARVQGRVFLEVAIDATGASPIWRSSAASRVSTCPRSTPSAAGSSSPRRRTGSRSPCIIRSIWTTACAERAARPAEEAPRCEDFTHHGQDDPDRSRPPARRGRGGRRLHDGPAQHHRDAALRPAQGGASPGGREGARRRAGRPSTARPRCIFVTTWATSPSSSSSAAIPDPPFAARSSASRRCSRTTAAARTS